MLCSRLGKWQRILSKQTLVRIVLNLRQIYTHSLIISICHITIPVKHEDWELLRVLNNFPYNALWILLLLRLEAITITAINSITTITSLQCQISPLWMMPFLLINAMQLCTAKLELIELWNDTRNINKLRKTLTPESKGLVIENERNSWKSISNHQSDSKNSDKNMKIFKKSSIDRIKWNKIRKWECLKRWKRSTKKYGEQRMYLNSRRNSRCFTKWGSKKYKKI